MTRARILADYVSGGTTAAEFDYMDGVTSNIQTQFTAKAPLASPAFTGTPTGITAAHITSGVLPVGVTGGSGLDAVSAGKVLQVVQDVKTDTASTSSASWVDTIDIAQAITPSSTTSKVLVICDVNLGDQDDTAINFRIVRGSTTIYVGDTAGSRHRASAYFRGKGNAVANHGSTYLDSPSTDASVTYKLQWIQQSASYTGYLNRDGGYTDNTSYATTASSITLMEIGA